MPLVMSERPPVAEEVEHVEIRHGERVVDPYRWMRDDDRKNPKIIAYLEAENTYTDAVMKPTEPLQRDPNQRMLDF